MESDRAVLGAVIFIAMILGANLVMYAIARGATRSSGKSFIEMLGKSLNTSTRPKDNSLEELRRRVEELEQGGKDSGEDTE